MIIYMKAELKWAYKLQPGPCSRCEQPITAGQKMIRGERGYRWHLDCWNSFIGEYFEETGESWVFEFPEEEYPGGGGHTWVEDVRNPVNADNESEFDQQVSRDLDSRRFREIAARSLDSLPPPP